MRAGASALYLIAPTWPLLKPGGERPGRSWNLEAIGTPLLRIDPERKRIEDVVVAWCEEVYVCRKEFLCPLVITMFERNYAAIATTYIYYRLIAN